MKRQIVVGLVAAAAAAAAVLERPWGTAQAQQAGDTPQTMPSLADISKRGATLVLNELRQRCQLVTLPE